HDDRHLAPAEHLEVMVERARSEDASAARELEVRPLHDDGTRLDDEESADEEEEQLRAAQDRERGEASAEPERARVPHEDLGGRRVVPEEADERADDRRGRDREIERVAHLVARLSDDALAPPEAPLLELPEADDDVRDEC